MKKYFYLFVLSLLFLSLPFTVSAKQWPAIGLTGGGNALDGIDTSECTDGDIAFVWNDSGTSGWYLTYHFISGDSSTEASPIVIAPDTGTGRWHLDKACYKSATYVLEDPTTDENFGSVRLEHGGSIVKVVTVVQGSSPYVDFNIKYYADRSQDGTSVFSSNKRANSISTGNSWTLTGGDFTNYTPSANNWVWIRTSATGGTVDEISITVFYVYHS